MRWAAGTALLALLGSCGMSEFAVPRPSAHPLRVMSLNQCTDQIVLALLPPNRITSVTWLSRNPGSSLMHEAAERVGMNHGTVEEVIRERPDLVIAGTFTTTATRAMLRRLGYPMLELDPPNSFEDIRRMTRQVAAAVDARDRGETLITDMDRELAALALNRGPATRVAAWDETGFAAGPGSLEHEVLDAAGAHDIAADLPAGMFGRPNAELLLAADPDLLVQGSPAAASMSRGDDVTHHRVVREHWRGRLLTVPQAYYVCGTPAVAHAATMLRDQLRAIAEEQRR